MPDQPEPDDADAGGLRPRRSDLGLVEQALRNDWPIPAAVKRQLLQAAINLACPCEEEDPKPLGADPDPDGGGDATRDDYGLSERVDIGAKRARVKLRAMTVVGLFAGLSLKQQALDLARERHELAKLRQQRPDGDTYDDIPDDEPDVEPRADPPEGGMQGQPGPVQP